MISTHLNLIRCLAAGLLSLCISLPLAASELPDLGHPSEQTLSPEQEKELGDAFIRALKVQASLIEDELVVDYIRNLGLRLAANSPERSREFHFFVIDADEINAFAGPNAVLGINKGLILAAKNESQLASVIAHEIAHVTQKHLTRAFQAGEDTSLTTLAAVLAGVLVSAADPTAGAALVFGGVASGMQQQINFTRSNEYEADRIGIQILDNSNINPQGMTEFFEILQSSSFFGTENDIEYLRTHPLNSARIAEAASRTPAASRQKPRDSLLFELARQRLLIASHDNPSELIKSYSGENLSAAKLYGKALLLARLNQKAEALTIFDMLIKQHNHLWYRLGRADVLIEMDDNKRAIASLNELYTIYPDYPAVIHRLVKVLISENKLKQAINILEQARSQVPDTRTYQLLAQAYSLDNQLIKAYTVRAEQYANDGFYEYAIQQLTNALKQPNLSEESLRRINAKIQIYKKQHKIE